VGRFTAAWLSLVGATAGYAQQPSQQQQTEYRIKADVRLVRLLTTVKDPAGELVGDLSKSDFKISDNGVPQEISVFERTTAQPLSVSILVDTSSSTAILLKYEMDSVQKFLRALFREGNTEDRASLYSFSWEVALESNFTRSITKLESALKRLKPSGGTAMYDALQFAGRHLDGRDGRHVIIVVTDGSDTVSTVKFADALEAVQRADAVIYPILVVPITNGAGRAIGGENALATLAAETGGRVFTPSVGAELDTAFDKILRDLRSQYLLGYYPKNIPPSKNRFHRVKIETAKPGLRISARSGYYGDASQP
jgi:Ca-activated chloride channel family protein